MKYVLPRFENEDSTDHVQQAVEYAIGRSIDARGINQSVMAAIGSVLIGPPLRDDPKLVELVNNMLFANGSDWELVKRRRH